jgi:transcriptional regulator of met regulon
MNNIMDADCFTCTVCSGIFYTRKQLNILKHGEKSEGVCDACCDWFASIQADHDNYITTGQS